MSSTSSFPIYPTPAERPSSDLPPPLHAGGLLAADDPIDVCAPLDWSDKKWAGRAPGEVTGWGIAKRIKGPAELEEDAIDAAMLDVWVVAVQAQRDTRLVLEFVRDQFPTDSAVKHLKKVARRCDPAAVDPASPQGPVTMVVLCSYTLMGLDDLVSALGAYHPSLASLAPFKKTVPASPARTQEQLAAKSPIWPVAFAASVLRPSDSTDWSAARIAWVQAGLRRCVDVAREAKAQGELPVGVFCVSPPESLWPTVDGFIPPTPLLRASGYDTRQSTNHPLKHASFNCIRNIANLRTQAPFADMQPKRNGADYLLTSLSLFVTHEPCPMCCMALLHSRVREVFYLFASKRGGGFESAFGVHGRKDLNHRFEVWRYEGQEVEAWRDELRVGDEYAL
jgi:tRNA-specific adenosine deaminase 3